MANSIGISKTESPVPSETKEQIPPPQQAPPQPPVNPASFMPLPKSQSTDPYGMTATHFGPVEMPTDFNMIPEIKRTSVPRGADGLDFELPTAKETKSADSDPVVAELQAPPKIPVMSPRRRSTYGNPNPDTVENGEEVSKEELKTPTGTTLDELKRLSFGSAVTGGGSSGDKAKTQQQLKRESESELEFDYPAEALMYQKFLDRADQ